MSIKVDAGPGFISIGELVGKQSKAGVSSMAIAPRPLSPETLVSGIDGVITDAPPLDLTSVSTVERESVNHVTKRQTGVTPPQTGFPSYIRRLLIGAYVFLVLLCLATTMKQLGRIRRMKRIARCNRLPECNLYRSHIIDNPFSVMRDIFMKDDYPADKFTIIFAHEKQHILHLHYIDMVIIEVLTVLFWFNPVIWIIRKELRSVHEFQVDASLLGSGMEREKYMMTILEETAGVIPLMANGFNSSLIKKRFMKMKNGNQIKFRMLRIALMIPFMALLLVFFSFNFTEPSQAAIIHPEAENSVDIQADKNPVTDTVPSPEASLAQTENTSVSETPQRTDIPVSEAPQRTEYTATEIPNEPQPMTGASTDSIRLLPANSARMEKGSEDHDLIFTDYDWARHGITKVSNSDGSVTFLTPDGRRLSLGQLRGCRKYDGKYLSQKEVTLIYERQRGNLPSRIYSIETNKHETRVTLAVNIYHDSNWLFIDNETCLIDPKTGDRYMVRDLEGGQEIGRMCVVNGLKGKVIEQTIIFPPLKKSVKVIDFFEPDNFTDLPANGTNTGGLRIKNIRIDDYPVRKRGDVIL